MPIDAVNTFLPILVDGQSYGYYSLSDPSENGDCFFTQIVVDELSQKNGIGSNLYMCVASELEQDGMRLISDPESFSAAALALWLSLERKGLAASSGAPQVDELGDVRGISFVAITHRQ